MREAKTIKAQAALAELKKNLEWIAENQYENGFTKNGWKGVFRRVNILENFLAEKVRP